MNGVQKVVEKSAYCHLRRIDVTEGQVVKQGQVIATSGGNDPTRIARFQPIPPERRKPNGPKSERAKPDAYPKPFGRDGTNAGAHLHYEGKHGG